MQPTTCDTVRAAARRPSFLLGTSAVLLLSAAAAFAPPARGQSYDFNGGSDAGWTRYSPLGGFGAPGDFSFPGGGYRIQAPVSPSAGLGPGRAGGFLSGPSYNNFYVTVDLVNWNNDLDQAFGLLARTTQLGLGTTDGYALTYSTQPGGGSTLDLSRIHDEGSEATLNSRPVSLVSGRPYRLIFEGNGSTLTGRVFDVLVPDTILATVTATDAAYPSGINGIFVFDNSDAANATADATFDNFFAADTVPVPEPAAAGTVLVLLAARACGRRRRA